MATISSPGIGSGLHAASLAAGRPVAGPDMGCAIGDRAAPSPSFAVWGDSHAAAMAPGIDAAASAAVSIPLRSAR